MREGLGGDLQSAEHARHFADPLARIQRPDLCAGRAAAGVLVDLQVVVGERGDLGQMGDAQHLMAFAQAAQVSPHRLGHRAADAVVHLIED